MEIIGFYKWQALHINEENGRMDSNKYLFSSDGLISAVSRNKITD